VENVFIENPELKAQMDKLIKKINAKSKLPLPLLSAYNPGKISKCEMFIPNFMSRDYYYKNYALSFSGYPTDEHDMRLTDIDLESKEYHVLGINVNDKKKIALKILEANGFEPAKERRGLFFLDDVDYDEVMCFENLDVTIGLQFNDDIVVGIGLFVKTYYLGNRMY
jgi:hypothetical protein